MIDCVVSRNASPDADYYITIFSTWCCLITIFGIAIKIFDNQSKNYVFFNDKGITFTDGLFTLKEHTYEWSQIRNIYISSANGLRLAIYHYSTDLIHCEMDYTGSLTSNEAYLKEIFKEINTLAGRNIASYVHVG